MFGNTFWAAPDPPKLDLRNICDYRTSGRLKYIQITPDVKGLLVCCAGWGVQGIHACTALSRPSRRIVDITERDIPCNLLFWAYFPINSRETIEDAWVNESRGHYGPSCLMVSCRVPCPPSGSYIDDFIASHIPREDRPPRT